MACATALLCLQAPVTLQAAPSTVGLDCLIQPSQTVQVGTASAGVVQSMRVERGDYVRRGQALVQLESRVERASLAMAREKADALGEAQATRGATDLAQRELERAADLVKDNFVSRTFYDRQRAEVEVASGRGQQAEERRRLAEREVQLATAQLAQRTVVSPVDGVVVERHVSPGEYVEQKPVLRIAQIDPLRVDVLVPAAAFGQVSVGDRAQVTPELLNKMARQATVTGVDRVIDAASHTFRVRLELPNPGGKLPPGLRCKADLVAAIGKGLGDTGRDDKPAQRQAPATGSAPPPADKAGGKTAQSTAIAPVGSIPVKWATQVAYDAPAEEFPAPTATADARPRLQLTWTTEPALEPVTALAQAQPAAPAGKALAAPVPRPIERAVPGPEPARPADPAAVQPRLAVAAVR